MPQFALRFGDFWNKFGNPDKYSTLIHNHSKIRMHTYEIMEQANNNQLINTKVSFKKRVLLN